MIEWWAKEQTFGYKVCQHLPSSRNANSCLSHIMNLWAPNWPPRHSSDTIWAAVIDINVMDAAATNTPSTGAPATYFICKSRLIFDCLWLLMPNHAWFLNLAHFSFLVCLVLYFKIMLANWTCELKQQKWGQIKRRIAIDTGNRWLGSYKPYCGYWWIL